MAKINVLSFEIANLIAAGEVVERPSSVLKELIENSIDSGATSIVAEIKRGGVALIRVTDNGCGIEKEDLPVALKRHATSKIREKEDLDSIMTLGFRGEALAAISSVSEMTIISKTREAEVATMLTASAGRVVDISEVGASEGTTVVVENLFGNVPARRKFLKKDATEAMNVTALVEKVALSHPEISIQLLIDGEQRFKTPGDGDLYNTVYSVFGREFAGKLIKAEGVANGVKVHGYIGRSDNVKKNRNLQNFFINGRYVKSMTAMAAIEKAYTSYIAPECFPTCILFLEMNPGAVDVNVHPAKLEVKFTDERSVFEAIYYTVKTALEDHEYRPEMTLPQAKKNDYNPLGAFVPLGSDTKGEQIKLSVNEPSARVSVRDNVPSEYKAVSNKSYSEYFSKKDTPISVASSVGKKFSSDAIINRSEMTPKSSLELLEKYGSVKRDIENEKEKTEDIPPIQVPEYKLVGEAFDCYIIVERDNELFLIDKHAAHERIIFEDLNSSRKANKKISSQSLLLPLTLMLSPDEVAILNEHQEEIKGLGFDFNVAEKSVDLLAVPGAIDINDAENLFLKMTDDLVLGKGNPEINEDIRSEKALYQIACKAAIKGGRMYNQTVTKWVVDKVMTLPDITVCPHGRPIAYKLTKREIDKQFERIK